MAKCKRSGTEGCLCENIFSDAEFTAICTADISMQIAHTAIESTFAMLAVDSERAKTVKKLSDDPAGEKILSQGAKAFGQLADDLRVIGASVEREIAKLIIEAQAARAKPAAGKTEVLGLEIPEADKETKRKEDNG